MNFIFAHIHVWKACAILWEETVILISIVYTLTLWNPWSITLSSTTSSVWFVPYIFYYHKSILWFLVISRGIPQWFLSLISVGLPGLCSSGLLFLLFGLCSWRELWCQVGDVMACKWIGFKWGLQLLQMGSTVLELFF